MTVIDGFRPLRGAVRSAVLWGAGWFTVGLGLFTALRLAGLLQPTASWADGLGIAIRFGVFGVIAGGAFAGVTRFLYYGRRLGEISWWRFGIIGGVFTGLYVPAFLQAMNLISGDGMVPWGLVLDDGVWAAVFGGVAAGGSLKLAHRTEAAAPGVDAPGHRARHVR